MGWGNDWGMDWGNDAQAQGAAGAALSISRTPVTLVVVTLDFCQQSFGVAPCLATGTPCYNTFHTCKYKSAYTRGTKDYKFTTNPQIPFRSGERPYLSEVSYMATEISDNLTVKGTTKITLADEPDTDVGTDPYVTQRPLFPKIPGTFWKKFIARNPNYSGRPVSVYEGYMGQPESAYTLSAMGTITNVTVAPGECVIEIQDTLADLTQVDVPTKINCSLVAAIGTADDTITLSDVSEIPLPNQDIAVMRRALGSGQYSTETATSTEYVLIGSEIIGYTGVDADTNQLTGCTRGQFGTTASAAAAKAKVELCRYYAPQNPFNLLLLMLQTDGGIDASQIDTGAFYYWQTFPAQDVNFSALITGSDTAKFSDLYFEIVDLLDCKSWVNEQGLITIARNLPNQPGRAYATVTDQANIMFQSTSVDLNDVRSSGLPSRITRFSLYWGKSVMGKSNDPTAFSYLNVAIDEDAESADDYGTPVDKGPVYCRWINFGNGSDAQLPAYVENLLARTVWRQRDALPLMTLDVELKDLAILTGQWVSLSTKRIQNTDGTDISGMPMQVVKRQRSGSKITLELLKVCPRRILFVAPAGTPNYSGASGVQREYGFIAGSDGKMPNGDAGYGFY